MADRRNKNKDTGELTVNDLLHGHIPHDVIQEINVPEKLTVRNRMTKDYMSDFFNRNLTRPTMEKSLPAYLKPFKLPEDEDTKEIFGFFKSGQYDITEEETMLT